MMVAVKEVVEQEGIFCSLDTNESETFHSHLNCLMHAVPALWITCGRAEAALSARMLAADVDL